MDLDWKKELDFELDDAAELVSGLRLAPDRELAALADRLAHRAGVIRGFVARLELLTAGR
jgi:hypothetical protein